jgi:uncharacterized protein Yka (UPF0111/DUF47 family)
MKLREWLIPQDKVFFELLASQIIKVVKASTIFHKALANDRFDKRTVSSIRKLEKECDEIVHDLFTRLNRTFITPIDHEDIGKLTLAGDDLIDLIYEISRKILIYGVNGKNKILLEFSSIVKEMIDEVSTMVVKSNKLSQKPLLSHAKKVHRLENKADDLLVKSLGKVFKKNDIKALIKEKEIYELLEVLTDKVEDFCDLIQGIVTKNL